MLDRKTWETKVQSFEAGWWGDCANTFSEEQKQIAYAKVMGMDPGPWKGGDHWPVWDFSDKTIIDVGGGPSSMLLKTRFSDASVIDPCTYPEWTEARYRRHGVRVDRVPAEDGLAFYDDQSVDEAWLYNVLQHTYQPEAIVRHMRRVAKVVRIFEWIDTPPHPGHPHTLHSADLEEWVGAPGQVVWLDEVYQEIGPASPSTIRQPAWGGVFQ